MYYPRVFAISGLVTHSFLTHTQTVLKQAVTEAKGKGCWRNVVTGGKFTFLRASSAFLTRQVCA